MSSFETMLERHAKRLTARQWRLFACACVRRVSVATKGNSGAAIDLAERFADGQATEHQLASARFGGRFQAGNAAWAVCWDPKEDSRSMAERAAAWAAGLLGDPSMQPYNLLKLPVVPRHRDRTSESLLFTDIAAHFIEPAHLDPLWLAWNDGTLRDLAGAIYDERAWDNMPILGDALEDAGCQDARLLDHCRGSGTHTRGCWVVDLVLGMK